MAKSKTRVMSDWTVAEIKKELAKRKVEYDPKEVRLKEDLFILMLNAPLPKKKAAKKPAAKKAVAKSKTEQAKRKKSQKRTLATVPAVKKKAAKKKTDTKNVIEYVPEWKKKGIADVKVIDNESVFASGAMCHLRIRRFAGMTKAIKDLFGEDVPKELVKGVQLLLPAELLDDFQRVRTLCKGYLNRNSLPFPVDGLNFVPKDRVEEIDKFFQIQKEKYMEMVEDLIDAYDGAKLDYKKKYPKLYRPEKYPSKEGLRRRFSFQWSFRVFTIPDKEMGLLTPEMYKREAETFKSQMAEMREMSMEVMRKGLLARLTTLQRQCVDDKINAGTVNAVNKLLDRWEQVYTGYVDHAAFRKTIKTIQKEMLKTDADRLKDNDSFREKFGKKVKKIVNQLERVEDKPKRRKLIA